MLNIRRIHLVAGISANGAVVADTTVNRERTDRKYAAAYIALESYFFVRTFEKYVKIIPISAIILSSSTI